MLEKGGEKKEKKRMDAKKDAGKKICSSGDGKERKQKGLKDRESRGKKEKE